MAISRSARTITHNTVSISFFTGKSFECFISMFQETYHGGHYSLHRNSPSRDKNRRHLPIRYVFHHRLVDVYPTKVVSLFSGVGSNNSRSYLSEKS